MTMQLAFATVIGGIVFAFLVNFAWGKLVEDFGGIGGWLAAGFIVGSTWALNHGIGLVTQSGKIWMDMAIAVSVGVLVCSTMNGGKLSKAMPTLVAAIIGGTIAGLALGFVL